MKLAAQDKKPCLYDGSCEFPVFIAPGGINEDYGKEADIHVRLFSPPPGTLQLQVIGDETMKGKTIVLLLYDASKKVIYSSRTVLNEDSGRVSLTPQYFSVKTDTGVEHLSAFTKGTTCRVYNDFYSGSIIDWPVQISKEFTF